MTNIILFWDKDDVLSNFYLCNYHYKGNLLTCSEQGYMYEKAIYFNDYDIAKKILLLSDPAQIKKTGKLVRGFDAEKWSVVKREKMYHVCFAKFTSSDQLKNYLLNTGDTILAESSPYDLEWGIGYGKWQPEAYKPKLWLGKNLLGEVLMEIRTNLVK